MRHDKIVQLKIRNVDGSYFQKKFNHSHKMSKMAGYTIQKTGDNYIVQAPPNQEEGEEVPMSQTYTLFPNPRSVCVERNSGLVEGAEEGICECLCNKCPIAICAHKV